MINKFSLHLFFYISYYRSTRFLEKIKIIKMKLLTHNMLTSAIIKGVQKGYPLGILVITKLKQTALFNLSLNHCYERWGGGSCPGKTYE